VYPDTRVEASLTESVALVGAPQVWALSDDLGRPVTGVGIRVAIIDSGVDYAHPALGGCFGNGCRVAGGYDFVHDDGDPVDNNGHGTHVAGIAAADGFLHGVAPGAELLAYKVLNETGWGYASDVIAALERAVADGAGVINLSLGGAGTADDPLSQAAVDGGCVVVAAAGNSGPHAGTVQSPAVAPGVIAVAAADKGDALADWSARGPVAGSLALKPDLTAPGVAISSTVPLTGPLSSPSGWLRASGARMAAPHVADGAVLLRQLHPQWTPQETKAALMNYALDLQVDLFAQGAGRLDLPPAATPGLLTVPPSLSFGLSLLDGTQALTLTVRNLQPTPQVVTPILILAYVADGTGEPISPTLPVAYAAVTPETLLLAPGESRPITVTLEIPEGAADGYYQGRVRLQGSSEQAAVPMAFALLSRVTVRVLDESGGEIADRGHMAVLARVPDSDFLVSNIPLRLPATSTVPAGDYYAQAFGRVGLYDHLLIPGLAPQVPYALIQPVTVAAHLIQTITLSLAEARRYWLDATQEDGSPAFINACALSFRYDEGAATWLTRLGQSHVRVLSTDLPRDWPTGFAMRLSDPPPGVTFSLALQEVGFSPLYRDFVLRHGARWPADPSGGFGFPLIGSADQVACLAWERPALGASTPTTFTLAAGEGSHFTVRTDLSGPLEPPWLGWETGGEAWHHPPTGAGSGLEPVAPGLSYSLTVAGAHHAVYLAGDPGEYRLFQRPLYTRDWAHTRPWAEDPNVVFPDETALIPLPANNRQGSSAAADGWTLGAGPLYPALVFANQPDKVRVRHPLLAGATGSPVNWGPASPAYALTLDGSVVVTGALSEWSGVPSPQRTWPGLPAGTYGLTITPTLGLTGVGPVVISAGLGLTGTPNADLDPPQVLGLALSERFDPAGALTATWTLSDSSPVSLSAAARLGSDLWHPLPVETVDLSRVQARIEPGGALTVSLAYTATDATGNWIAWQGTGAAATLAQIPVTLAFDLDPPHVPWGQRPVTVRIVGSLLDADGQPQSDRPVWLRLEAGGHLVGYARDLTGSTGQYRTGVIGFPWTFVPASLAETPGKVPVRLSLDLGSYSAQAVTQSLHMVPGLYLPLNCRASPR